MSENEMPTDDEALERSMAIPNHPPPRKFRALIVDDSPEVLKSLKSYFEIVCGCVVTDCAYADKAMDLIKGGYQPDFIISDFDLGSGYTNGIQFCQAVREYDLLNHNITTPFFLYSGMDHVILRAMADESGCGVSDVFEKVTHPASAVARIIGMRYNWPMKKMR